MKVWRGYGSEHSANLVIIGHFKSADRARSVRDLIESAISVAADDEREGLIEAGVVPDKFSDTMLSFLSANNISFTHADAESLLYPYDIRVDGSDIVVTTEEQVINGLMTLLVDKGARVEVYSAHMHPSPYGRPTYDGD